MALVRIAGTTIPNNKRVEIALTYIYGIGNTQSADILKNTKINPDTRVQDLSDEEIAKLRLIIEKNYKIEGDLRRDIQSNIKYLKEVGAYRGIRHSKGLTVRGQRTKTNSRTVRGNTRKTAASGKKGPAQKT